MQGGCFTISSLGGIGGTNFTPIVNAPEVGILGLTRSQSRLVRQDDDIVDRLIQPLAVSYDHRVIDGAYAARFVSHLAFSLSDVRNLCL
jgi:pyruvate dehydrogenase E2 component (dihydrolipoamide acetyltransferase)